MRLFSSFLFGALSLFSLSAHASQWANITQPIAGQPEPIGSYSNGCVVGAEALPFEGAGYQVLRTQNRRYFGHPSLIQFVQRISQRAQAQGLPTLLIGDMAMPAGGRFLSGHSSHQTGLDVDIWLRNGPLSAEELANPRAQTMVDAELKQVNALFGASQQALIQLAAEDPNVNRLFVNPAIKLALCQRTTGDRSWLQKVRPWYNHDYHMHVRLNCPDNAPFCEKQAPLPAGDGCGAELASWFKPAPVSTSSGIYVKAVPMAPARCQVILQEQLAKPQ